MDFDIYLIPYLYQNSLQDFPQSILVHQQNVFYFFYPSFFHSCYLKFEVIQLYLFMFKFRSIDHVVSFQYCYLLLGSQFRREILIFYASYYMSFILILLKFCKYSSFLHFKSFYRKAQNLCLQCFLCSTMVLVVRVKSFLPVT